MKQKIILIKCLDIVYQDDPKFLTQYKEAIRDILQGITVRKVFQMSEEAAIKLCELVRKEEIISRAEVQEDLAWIMNTKGGQISRTFYDKICAIQY